MKTSIKMAVIGSREFNNYEYMKSVLKWYDINTIISGGARGADKLVRRYASENDITLKEYIPNWKKNGRAAGILRNTLIIRDAEEVVAFWNGKSKGTQHSITLAKEQNKPVYIYWPEKDQVFDVMALGK